MYASDGQKSPGRKLLFAILDRHGPGNSTLLGLVAGLRPAERSPRRRAASITEGWGGPQAISGPVLVIPYRSTTTETSVGTNNAMVSRTREVWKELVLEPEAVDLKSNVTPELRKRSIYEAVVYDATAAGAARFAFPPDLPRYGVEAGTLDLSRAELRFGLSDPRGLGANPNGQSRWAAGPAPTWCRQRAGQGFFRLCRRCPARSAGRWSSNSTMSFAAMARWRCRRMPATPIGAVTSSWPHPSFGGSFLPGPGRREKRVSPPITRSAIWRLAARWCRPTTRAAAISPPAPHRVKL